VRWKTFTTPPGLSGNAIWGTVPSVDPLRRLVFASTGNNYSVSPEVLACLEAEPEDPTDCSPPGNHFDAMMAFDMDTGRVVWSTAGWESDVWNTDCSPLFNPNGPGPDCPPDYAEGPDYDFGQAPTLLRVRIGGRLRDAVGAGQKSGVYWLLDRRTGAVLWSTQVGPGGPFGGLQWGSATDGERIYAAVSNSSDLTQPGTYAALDPATGEILWQVDDPGFRPGEFSGQGAVSVANGVVYGCSTSPRGEMFALDAETGETLWTFPSGGTCIAGASIVDGTVYWGSGYRRWGPPATGNNVFRAFRLD
jgi:polyvinyl alcohol dehydrogenase (cytochrome)